MRPSYNSEREPRNGRSVLIQMLARQMVEELRVWKVKAAKDAAFDVSDLISITEESTHE